MTTLREAAEAVIEQLKGTWVSEDDPVAQNLKAALAEPERNPLTDEEIDRITDQQWAANNHKPVYAAHRAYARAIERAHGITGEKDGPQG